MVEAWERGRRKSNCVTALKASRVIAGQGVAQGEEAALERLGEHRQLRLAVEARRAADVLAEHLPPWVERVDVLGDLVLRHVRSAVGGERWVTGSK